MIKVGGSVTPPHPPWQELKPSSDACGYLSVYYSDDMSRLPVRWVTKPGDNKSDPNLETCTYGLFSTCWRTMRAGIVNRRCSHLFFTTSRQSERVLTGYYHLGWYTGGVLGAGDYCIAADSARFIEKPLPLKEVDRRCGTNVSGWFRSMRILTADECKKLAGLIDGRPDATAAYLEEIDRLERFNMKHGGYRYISWKQTEKFTWDRAKKYVKPVTTTLPDEKVINTSPSGVWKCRSCRKETKNKALLKLCPHCGAPATLGPLIKR